MKRILSISCIFLTTIPLWSQGIIKGTVSNEETQEYLEGVTILNHRSQQHTHTEAKGHFKLPGTSFGDTLSFYSLGFKNQQIVVDADFLTISMSEVMLELDQIIITPNLKTLNTLSAINVELNPVGSSQDILQTVPGLFIGQHAGGGKAEQIFLRGFDIDHGTDIQISADGMPVNMVSHAHGQGYSDLHFLIPETIKNIDFGKGPYYSSSGNFTTAGYVDFQSYDQLYESTIKLDVGSFNTRRAVGMIDLIEGTPKTDAYLATEYLLSDGPFESPQNLDRLNVFGKYITEIQNNTLTLQASTFSSQWNASGQIPMRAVQSGFLSRFGAIDDTEGGTTSRTNLKLDVRSLLNENAFTQSSFYISKYDFELFSNFTFFLNDPENGDQIRQKESRSIMGFNTSYNRYISLGNSKLQLEGGLSLRNDQVRGNELSNTLNRTTTLEQLSLTDINESNVGLYADAKMEHGPWLLDLGVRADHFQFEMINYLTENKSSKATNKSIISPKINVVYCPSTSWQLYAKAGKGFHSNDSRVILNQENSKILPAAFGYDLGGVIQAWDRLYFNAAFWSLYMEQEFVYVGDEGIVETSGRTLRQGVDLGVNYQMLSWLFADLNMNYASPRALDQPEHANHLPLAPTFTSIGGVSAKHTSGFSGSVRYRQIADRPANEDNSIIAKGYFLTSASVRYDQKHWGIGLSADNLFNQKWNETQFATDSRLADETNSTEEIHFTPGTPLFIKLNMQVHF
ncbi:TonB-dependent receptor [Marinoscillum sp. MHG1-6]|uniref:TonB-dependent receptor n=1 Tax=Marinoscillum sp. MHG1-6 TaxID=2959627 RepID=UPI0021588901|nr:TonB-dependent receptor [Marinoscillum sp. MHG1-6]